jgi:hypothetical protein
MAYAHKVNRVTLSGTMYNGSEEWSTGFFLGHEDADVIPNTEAELAELFGYWQTFFTSAAAGISWAFVCTGVKCAPMRVDGTTVLEEVATYSPGAAIAGGNAVTGFPPQVSLVASLVAAQGKGIGKKGRMYIPGVAHPIMGDGHMAWDKVQGVSTAFQTFVQAVNDSPNIWGRFINASRGRTIPAAAPVNMEITEIRIGNVYDTQRRRRNGLVEGYDAKPITIGV